MSAVYGLKIEPIWSHRPARSFSRLRKAGVTRGQPKRVRCLVDISAVYHTAGCAIACPVASVELRQGF